MHSLTDFTEQPTERLTMLSYFVFDNEQSDVVTGWDQRSLAALWRLGQVNKLMYVLLEKNNWSRAWHGFVLTWVVHFRQHITVPSMSSVIINQSINIRLLRHDKSQFNVDNDSSGKDVSSVLCQLRDWLGTTSLSKSHSTQNRSCWSLQNDLFCVDWEFKPYLN